MNRFLLLLFVTVLPTIGAIDTVDCPDSSLRRFPNQLNTNSMISFILLNITPIRNEIGNNRIGPYLSSMSSERRIQLSEDDIDTLQRIERLNPDSYDFAKTLDRFFEEIEADSFKKDAS